MKFNLIAKVAICAGGIILHRLVKICDSFIAAFPAKRSSFNSLKIQSIEPASRKMAKV